MYFLNAVNIYKRKMACFLGYVRMASDIMYSDVGGKL